MSVERAFEGWEGFQRQGQDIADRFSSLAQGLGCMLQSHIRSSRVTSHSVSQAAPLPPPSDELFLDRKCCDPPGSWHWPWIIKPRRKARSNRVQFNGRRRPCASVNDGATEDKFSVSQGAAGIQELGQRLGQAGAELGACVGSFVCHVVRHFSWPFQTEAERQPTPQPSQSQPLVTLEFQGDYMEWREVDEAGTCENKGKVALGGAWKRFDRGRHRRVEEDSRSSQESTEFDDVSDDDVFTILTKRQANWHRQSFLDLQFPNGQFTCVAGRV